MLFYTVVGGPGALPTPARLVYAPGWGPEGRIEKPQEPVSEEQEETEGDPGHERI